MCGSKTVCFTTFYIQSITVKRGNGVTYSPVYYLVTMFPVINIRPKDSCYEVQYLEYGNAKYVLLNVMYNVVCMVLFCVAGEVLGERTVLNFPHQTEDSCDEHVMHPHTGRAGHATGYQTQLQFNLYPTLEHVHDSIVNHPPRPPPVVIERLPPQHMTTHERLEMAALLARRDFRNGRIPAELLSAEQSENTSSEEGETPEAREEIVPIQPQPVQVVQTAQSNVPPVLSGNSCPHVKPQKDDHGIDKMASEVVSLRRQLRRQVSRLREAVHDRRTSKVTVEDEDDIERELRREDGRSLRNMQSLYALQQQVPKNIIRYSSMLNHLL